MCFRGRREHHHEQLPSESSLRHTNGRGRNPGRGTTNPGFGLSRSCVDIIADLAECYNEHQARVSLQPNTYCARSHRRVSTARRDTRALIWERADGSRRNSADQRGHTRLRTKEVIWLPPQPASTGR